MDLDPTPPRKSTRTKASASGLAPKAPRKSSTTTRKKATAQEAVPNTPPTTDINAMIQITAFYLAAERGFTPGHELDDWLEAERRIRSTLTAAP